MHYVWSSGPPYFYKQLACGKKLLLCVYRVWVRVSRLPSHLFRIVKCYTSFTYSVTYNCPLAQSIIQFIENSKMLYIIYVFCNV